MCTSSSITGAPQLKDADELDLFRGVASKSMDKDWSGDNKLQDFTTNFSSNAVVTFAPTEDAHDNHDSEVVSIMRNKGWMVGYVGTGWVTTTDVEAYRAVKNVVHTVIVGMKHSSSFRSRMGTGANNDQYHDVFDYGLEGIDDEITRAWVGTFSLSIKGSWIECT